jgi:hypothetical protein
MKFIEIAHPEGGTLVVHIDHIASALFRPSEGEQKARLSLDIDERQNELILFGSEAERVWRTIQSVVASTSA